MGLFSQSYTLILFPEALARTGGEAPEIFRWSDVREVYTFVNPFAGKHRIVAQDGRKLEIDASVRDGKKLGQTVQKTLFDRMLPAAVKSFDRSETLTFGPLRLDQNFLYYKDKRLAWNEIAKMSSVQSPDALPAFRGEGRRFRILPWWVKVQNIPNVDVFKALVERKRAFDR